MYKSRKKIIIISTLSILSLAGVSTGAYFIANSFHANEFVNKTETIYKGATAGLENKFDINDKEISLSSWIFSNMPERINVTNTSVDPSSTTNKSYTIEFIDYKYDSTTGHQGNMICSIKIEIKNNDFEYKVTTATNILGVNPQPLGGLKFTTNPNSVAYELTTYSGQKSNILLNSIVDHSVLDGQKFISDLIDDTYTMEMLMKWPSVPSMQNGDISYSIKNKSYDSIYENLNHKQTDKLFQYTFKNPIANTTLDTTILLDDTSTIGTKFSYGLSYRGVFSGSLDTDLTTTNNGYLNYAKYWSDPNLNRNAINMPNAFGTIGMMDFITKHA